MPRTKVKQPDRFERMVQKYAYIPADDYRDITLTDLEVIDLLRREHAWMKRIVRKIAKYQADMGATNGHACSLILNQLEKRRQ